MKARDLKVGDRLKAGEMVAEVKEVRVIVIGSAGETEKRIKVEGQPEIADWNLQKYIDQGSITIL